jgi:tetratricopeptide (TPR) repeat protein
MFKVRLKPSEQGTLERRYEFHLSEAVRAALLGDHEKAAKHCRTALTMSRELYVGARDRDRHRAGLAAALAGSARYQHALQAVQSLTESAGHYAALASAEPSRYEVERIDVLVRVALTADADGNIRDAIRLLREVVDMYRKVSAADPAARDAGLARACFHLGRCLLHTGEVAEGLDYTDAGLRAAQDALGDQLVPVGCTGYRPQGSEQCWLARAPRVVQLLAPDWAAAAARAMALHAAADQWNAAASAATAAVRISGGLAALGNEECGKEHAAIVAQARAIWARAQCSVPQSSWASAWTWRLRESSTSASAAARSTQRAPSTDLPGSRSL